VTARTRGAGTRVRAGGQPTDGTRRGVAFHRSVETDDGVSH
jgi:hypothetical protein